MLSFQHLAVSITWAFIYFQASLILNNVSPSLTYTHLLSSSLNIETLFIKQKFSIDQFSKHKYHMGITIYFSLSYFIHPPFFKNILHTCNLSKSNLSLYFCSLLEPSEKNFVTLSIDYILQT